MSGGLRSEPLFDLTADFEERYDVGPTAFGRRRVYRVANGRFDGPLLRGVLLPGAGDWVLKGADGTLELDVRATMRTDDDHLVYLHYRGVFAASAEVAARMDAGAPVGPEEYYYRTTPRFETGSTMYGWLNTVVAVGVGRRTDTGVAYRVHRVL